MTMHGELEIEVFVESTFGENAYVAIAPAGDPAGGQNRTFRQGWVIDPSFPPAVYQLLNYVKSRQVVVTNVILTHGHADHIAGLDIVKNAHPEAVVWMPREEWAFLQDAGLNLSAPFGLPLMQQTRAEHDLAAGITLQLGQFDFAVLDVSGHSPGGRALFCPQAGVAIVGDALFAGSVGRTDFPGCDHAGLIRRVRENLLSLPGETVVYSGHGPATTIGNEQKFNPWVSE